MIGNIKNIENKIGHIVAIKRTRVENSPHVHWVVGILGGCFYSKDSPYLRLVKLESNSLRKDCLDKIKREGLSKYFRGYQKGELWEIFNYRKIIKSDDKEVSFLD